DLAKVGQTAKADRAIDLLYFYKTETDVNVRDRELLEGAADRAFSTHTRALALSLLCNWLSLAKDQVSRIFAAIADRTDEEFLCIKGCSCAALALQEITDPRLIRAVINVFRDETRLTGTRESARNALLRLDGMSSRDIVIAERSPQHTL